MNKYIENYMTNLESREVRSTSTNTEQSNEVIEVVQDDNAVGEIKPNQTNLIMCIIDEKDKSHPNGLIPNVEQFATVVKFNNKELFEDTPIEQVVEMIMKLSEQGW